MREIKFKAWNPERKIMFQVGDNYGTTHPLDCVVYAKQGQPVVLLQFTGLLDKNGKEIYEGDVVRSESWTVFLGGFQHKDGTILIEIKWHGVKWTGVIVGEKSGTYALDNFLSGEDGEVIGNIYENQT